MPLLPVPLLKEVATGTGTCTASRERRAFHLHTYHNQVGGNSNIYFFKLKKLVIQCIIFPLTSIFISWCYFSFSSSSHCILLLIFAHNCLSGFFSFLHMFWSPPFSSACHCCFDFSLLQAPGTSEEPQLIP